jgi:phospholipid transport system transporter-binding protein
VTTKADSAFQLSTSTPGSLGVAGVLDFTSAAAALKAMESALSDRAIVRLDLAGLRHADSAGLSCVVAVIAEAARQGRPLGVVHMPAGMHALAVVSEVDRLISP